MRCARPNRANRQKLQVLIAPSANETLELGQILRHAIRRVNKVHLLACGQVIVRGVVTNPLPELL
jgi:hypothetical protein